MRSCISLLATMWLVCAALPAAAQSPHVPREGPPPGGSHVPPPGGSAGMRHGGPPPVEVLGEEAERLGLDEKTRTAIRTIVKESRAEADRLREKVGDAREEMRRLLSSPETEETTVMRQADTIGALEVEEHKNWLRAMLRIRALLTPEQRAELLEMREEMFAQVFAGSRAACSGDIARLCPGISADADVRACMRRHREDLSTACRDAIAAEFAKRRRRF